jgi:hypothetical protein
MATNRHGASENVLGIPVSDRVFRVHLAELGQLAESVAAYGA